MEYKDFKSPHIGHLIDNNKPILVVCDNCRGNGQLPFGYYNKEIFIASNTSAEICKTCHGTGTILKLYEQ